MTWTGMIVVFAILAIWGLVIWAGIVASEERRLHREQERRRLEWEDEQR